jgi:leucyl-tRNA synthetase
MTVPVDTDEETLRVLALDNERVKEFVGDKTVRKIIVVGGRLVNVVV